MEKGLSSAEAAKRLKEYGPNELPSEKKRSPWRIFSDVIKEPMLLLLVGCGSVYIIIGEIKDAAVLSLAVVVVIGITFFQERKTQRALEALKDLSSPKALVIRDGEQVFISSSEVVRGDIIVLQEGDRVPADAVIISSNNLTIDESLLTGESLAVSKLESLDHSAGIMRPGSESSSSAYSGTLVVSGHGLARAENTGINTEIGKIGKALQNIASKEPRIKVETSRVVRIFAVIGLGLCLLVVLLYGFGRGDWLDGILAGLTLSMSMLPEEFPVILTIFLALGAWRISKHKVLACNNATIETLGTATVLCVDKTGTITKNMMKLAVVSDISSDHILGNKDSASLPDNLQDVLRYSILASRPNPFDPLDKELRHEGRHFWGEGPDAGWKMAKEYPFSKEIKAFSQAWQIPGEPGSLIAVKGAPEAIIDLCHLAPAESSRLHGRIKELAASGFRLLGVAKAYASGPLPEKDQHSFDFEFVGLVGFIDPIREAVPQALKEAYAAGIKVMMITGDYPGTAQYIAREIGLRSPEECLTGPEIENMDAEALRHRLSSVSICARVIPEQKLMIVEALKANGEVVAMTGDGVNDAPALKASHIGIAMGERGTDVAREAADLVLLDDDFASIIKAVRLGRQIYSNLKKAMAYALAVHVPIAGMSLLPISFGLPLVLLPIHIAFLELVIDPACSIVFEAQPGESGNMKRPPRPLSERLFSPRFILLALLQGTGMLAASFVVFCWYIKTGAAPDTARAMAFMTLVSSNVMLIITNLSWSNNFFLTIRKGTKALFIIVTCVFAAQLLIVNMPALSSLFRFSRLSLNDVLIALGASFASILWFEALKAVNSRRKKKILSE